MNSKKITPQTSGEDVELVLDAKAVLGEGSLWNPKEKVLYWVDIEGHKLHIYDPLTRQDRIFPVGARIGTVVPLEEGGVLVALQNGIHRMDTRSGELSFLLNPIQDPQIRFNDGKCDPTGRFWVGTMELNVKENAAVLYRIDKEKKVEQVLDKLTISNGIIWSLDQKTMYFIDTPTGVVQAFDFEKESGKISNGRKIIQIPSAEGHPDGMTIDEEGKLWVALYGGAAVGRWDPSSGKMLQKIQVPVPNVTSCAFGGEHLDTLYITTARNGLDEEKLEQFPLSGGLFSVVPGVKGVQADFCKIKV